MEAQTGRCRQPGEIPKRPGQVSVRRDASLWESWESWPAWLFGNGKPPRQRLKAVAGIEGAA